MTAADIFNILGSNVRGLILLWDVFYVFGKLLGRND